MLICWSSIFKSNFFVICEVLGIKLCYQQTNIINFKRLICLLRIQIWVKKGNIITCLLDQWFNSYNFSHHRKYQVVDDAQLWNYIASDKNKKSLNNYLGRARQYDNIQITKSRAFNFGSKKRNQCVKLIHSHNQSYKYRSVPVEMARKSRTGV